MALTIATLGPAGSNHALVAGRYAHALGVDHYRLVLVDDFEVASRQLMQGEVDCMVQCAAHPEVARTVGAHIADVFIVDTFIAASRPLGVLTRRDVERPLSIGFHPATRDYVDLGAWSQHIEEPSTVAVAESLLAGRYHSGIAALEVAEKSAGVLRIDEVIGSAQDAWLVYAARSVYAGEIIAWRDSPGARLLRGRAGAGP